MKIINFLFGPKKWQFEAVSICSMCSILLQGWLFGAGRQVMWGWNPFFVFLTFSCVYVYYVVLCGSMWSVWVWQMRWYYSFTKLTFQGGKESNVRLESRHPIFFQSALSLFSEGRTFISLTIFLFARNFTFSRSWEEGCGACCCCCVALYYLKLWWW